MNVYSVVIRFVILVVVVVPRVIRHGYWTALNALRVPLAVTAPLGAAGAVVTFWAPLALMLPGFIPRTVIVAVWSVITLGALISALRWFLVEVAAGRI